jgi:hypothetical protein
MTSIDALGPVDLLPNDYCEPFTSGVMRPRRETDHLLPSSNEVKNRGAATRFPLHLSSRMLSNLMPKNFLNFLRRFLQEDGTLLSASYSYLFAI